MTTELAGKGEADGKRTAIVTGGARGIGRAIAEALAGSGHRVVLADLNEDEGRAVAESVGGHFVRTDLSRRGDCRRVVDEALERFGGVHVLVNNAGFQHMAPVESFPEETWEQMLAVMLTAPFLLTKYAWPSMKSRGWGRVVNIASIQGLVASQFKSAYVTAKTGLIGFTRAAALEGGPLGITVNAICPAYVRTKLVEGQVADQARLHSMQPQEVIEKVMLEQASIKRLVEPDEVASLVQYVCSDKAAAITGAALTIDLGWTAK